MPNRPSRPVLDIVLLSLILLLSNLRGLLFYQYLAVAIPQTIVSWVVMALWFLAIIFLYIVLKRDNTLQPYFAEWRKNWLVVLFVIFALLSIFWSVVPVASVYRGLVIFASTLVGAYIGFRYTLRDILKILFWLGSIIVIISFAFVIVWPGVGIMQNSPYTGNWRGIFWHKNHLGTFMAFFVLVFLLRLLEGVKLRRSEALLDGVLYILTMLLVYLSDSATGYILLVILHGAVIAIVIWLRLESKMRPWHYYSALALLVAGLIAMALNLNTVFGLFNRSANLTGRVPLWIYLIQNVVSERQWFGHGFGAIWTIASFREGLQSTLNWEYPVLFSDNGFLDILLHLGVVGLTAFLLVLAVVTINSFKYAIKKKTLLDFFPVLLMVYSLTANLSFSLFLEIESFIWFLIVAITFLTTLELSRSG